MKKINAFILFSNVEQTNQTVEELKQSGLIHKIFLLSEKNTGKSIPGCEKICIDALQSTKTMKEIARNSDSDYTLIYLKPTLLRLGYFGLERMLRIAEDTRAGMVYADHYKVMDGIKQPHPVIDCQEGSLRDDFDFGSLILFNANVWKEAVENMKNESYRYAGLYDLRLKVSQKYPIVHINEYLYTEIDQDTRKSGEKLFDYVDPKNREVQIEMEQACTQHLKEVGAFLEPRFEDVTFDQHFFEYEASVVIPVRNRIRTIRDAIRSVLMQKTDFKFNLIVVDNHSTDGTTEAIDEFKDDERLIHLIPDRDDLNIGGCWNLAVHHEKCGKFSVQLDSDDVYSGEDTLQKIVNGFYEQNCAMLIGTYMITDFNMQMIPPGIIDHREWTPENGHNNALRINGLGAPRAFYTPLLREIKLPNTGYGEDYAVGLNISRRYRIGRIYEVLYYCRRWEGNTDASLDIEKMNTNNLYKNRIRTWELQARKQMNAGRAFA